MMMLCFSVPWNWSKKECEERDVALLGTYGLLSGEECNAMGGIPNAACPSDHLPLLAKFLFLPSR